MIFLWLLLQTFDEDEEVDAMKLDDDVAGVKTEWAILRLLLTMELCIIIAGDDEMLAMHDDEFIDVNGHIFSQSSWFNDFDGCAMNSWW